MKIIYADMKIPKSLPFDSVFLAGPTPRDADTPSWRPAAIKYLQRHKYNGAVFFPEWSTGKAKINYDTQVEWEHEGLNRALWIVFWIPRELVHMPAFTTNVEFGRFAHWDNVIYGRPDDAPKNRYLDWYYKKCHPQKPIFSTLDDTLKGVL